VRALFAYLALAPRPVPRGQLCELLWDVPNDPRGELRWCLSKIRALVDEPGLRRVVAAGDAVGLDLSGCAVDAAEVARATQDGLSTLAPERLRTLAGLYAGDFLEGLEIDRSPAFNGWMTVQRRRFRGCRVALLETIAGLVPDGEALRYLETWLELAPFDLRAHEFLLGALARRGQIREGEEHVVATSRLFESEGLDCAAIRGAWSAARAGHAGVPAQPANATPAPPPRSDPGAIAAASRRRASIAVMPFVDRSGGPENRGGAADALAHDMITRLAKLRSLFVIAQGTVFALHDRHVGPEQAGRMLNVDYFVSGSVQRLGNRLSVTVELAETRTSRIVWAEIFNQKAGDALLVLDEIGDSIVASIASEIETIERNRAILRPPSSLDAWEAHHCGLWHMYRFNRADNERAMHFFERAVSLDPTFSRAYAGLSFTHFQNAFQGWAPRAGAVDRAFEAAGQSLMADDRDPAAHWAMGRALWLRGRYGQSIVELECAVDLSPNFALGHYTLAFVQSQAGDPAAAISSSDHSRHLSPFDPLLFGMLGARAMALVRLGRFEEAAEWGVKAASRPNAHAHIKAIAAYSLSLAGRLDEARSHLAAIRRTLPDYGVRDFLAAMQFSVDGEDLFRRADERLRSA
jgi:TolB-like protein/DNA-binding SARP family transcriptional activator/Flp pilus assembly protein TadD